MSGHSKWATIKHKKGAADAARGKLFAKIARQLEVAARDGGGDPSTNATLRTAVLKAKAGQMTNDAIDRAIKRGTGEDDGRTYEAVTYEGYAPGGVALLIDVLTDNRNRTGSEIRGVFTRFGGSLAEPGAAPPAWGAPPPTGGRPAGSSPAGEWSWSTGGRTRTTCSSRRSTRAPT